MNYEKLESLKEGDIFYEEVRGNLHEFVVTSSPIKTYDEGLERYQYSWEGRVNSIKHHLVGQSFLVTVGMEHYGPRIKFDGDNLTPDYVY